MFSLRLLVVGSLAGSGMAVTAASLLLAGCGGSESASPCEPETMRAPGKVADALLLAADASSPTDVWVVGASDPLKESTAGLVLRWDGDHWTRMKIEGASALYDVAATAPNDAWALGPPRDLDDHDWLGHWDGTRWVEVKPPPELEQANLTAIAAVAIDDVWLVGTDFAPRGGASAGPYIAHWDGVAWSHSRVSVRSGLLEDISAFSADSVWAAGYASLDEYDQEMGTLVMRWDGHEWLRIATPEEIDGLDNITATARDEAWGVPDYFSGEPAPLWQWDGRAWTQGASPFDDISAMDALDGVLWAAGSNPKSVGISRLVDGEWEPASMTDVESLDVSDPFPGMTVASVTTAWGIGREPVASRACSGTS